MRLLNLHIIFVAMFIGFGFTQTLKAQVVFDTITPMDLQLVPRELEGTNKDKGEIRIKGVIMDNSSNDYNYDFINIRIYKSAALTDINFSGAINIYDEDFSISWNDLATIGDFDLPFFINAEKANYSFRIGFKKNDVLKQEKDILNVVAGDVYVIEGQSNALASKQPGGFPADNLNKNIFVRTFGSATKNDGLLNQLFWFQAIGDGPYQDMPGFIGQWGLKLGKEIVVNKDIPVAIFNGGQGDANIKIFLKTALPNPNHPQTKTNYNRLFYRLKVTGLKDHVRAIFWSQGENDTDGSTGPQYYNDLDELREDWVTDYGKILKKIYIFQTKSGCSTTPGANINGLTKEAQRLISKQYTYIHLMSTTGLTYLQPDLYNCHFDYYNGYEGFADRIFKLVDRDFYGNNSYSIYIEPPMPQIAYLSGPNQITLETDSNVLSLLNENEAVDKNDFLINDTSDNITDVYIDGSNKIFIDFSGSIASNSAISYIGVGAGKNPIDLIVNPQGLELVCFEKLPIDTSLKTIWNGSSWNPTAPVATMDAEINGNYDTNDGSLESRDLVVNSGKTIDFNSGNGGANNIIINGDLTNNGTMTIGDTESLITYGDVLGSGTFNKIEKTTNLKNQYDVTYFSSSVESANLASTFPGVASNRIFHYDPETPNPDYTGAYEKYRHWFVANANGNMIPGKGYSVDGRTVTPSGDSYPNYKMEVTFTGGKPNHGVVSVPISIFTSYGGDYDKTNLLGNPYPTAIDPIALIDENINNTGFQGTLYLWTHEDAFNGSEYNTDNYLTFNKVGEVPSRTIDEPYYIASGQGFMILTDNSSENFIFRPSMQVASENTYFYKSGKIKNPPADDVGRIWLRLRGGDNEEREVLVAFMDEASDKIDPGYDGRLFTIDGPLTFYTLIKKEKYVIQGLNSFAKNRNVKLGFSNTVTGDYSIQISKITGLQERQGIYLIDKELHITHDLSRGAYHFTQLETGDFANRFSLRFKNAEYEANASDSGFFDINSVDNGFEVASDQKIRDIKVYDILGRLIFHDEPNEHHMEFFIPKVKKGSIILINGTLANGKNFHKKKIKF